MSEYCVVVAELARARLFTLEPVEVPGVDAGPHLVERESLANPQRKADGSEIWTDTSGSHSERGRTARDPGRNNSVSIFTNQSFDDHREGNEAMHNRGFAKDVVEELGRLVRESGSSRVVVCAEPQVLGYLRPELEQLTDVRIQEVTKDLTGFSAHDLHRKLAEDGCLPPRQAGAGATPGRPGAGP